MGPRVVASSSHQRRRGSGSSTLLVGCSQLQRWSRTTVARMLLQLITTQCSTLARCLPQQLSATGEATNTLANVVSGGGDESFLTVAMSKKRFRSKFSMV